VSNPERWVVTRRADNEPPSAVEMETSSPVSPKIEEEEAPPVNRVRGVRGTILRIFGGVDVNPREEHHRPFSSHALSKTIKVLFPETE
jgi:hypothetical protein